MPIFIYADTRLRQKIGKKDGFVSLKTFYHTIGRMSIDGGACIKKKYLFSLQTLRIYVII